MFPATNGTFIIFWDESLSSILVSVHVLCFRPCATSLKVAGSIPDGVFEMLRCLHPSGHNMALGLTQPPTEMSTRCVSWAVKAAGDYG